MFWYYLALVVLNVFALIVAIYAKVLAAIVFEAFMVALCLSAAYYHLQKER